MLPKSVLLPCFAGAALLAATVRLSSQESSQAAAPTNPPSAKRVVHLSGEKSFQLVSLLVSGNASLRHRVRDLHDRSVEVRNLTVRSESTQKYDPSSPYFGLDVSEATGQIGSSGANVPFGEASALLDVLTKAGLRPDGDMGGSTVEAEEVDCRINTGIGGYPPKPARFACTIAYDPNE